MTGRTQPPNSAPTSRTSSRSFKARTTRYQADTAVTEQEAECTSTQAAYEAASKAVADKYQECEGHTGTNPCRDEIADLINAMTAAASANGNCGQELNQRKDALDTAQKALDDAEALVTSLKLKPRVTRRRHSPMGRTE
jgi:hypothetical protein